MLRSVCHLWLQKRMRSSDATCCAILAVNTWFFSLRVGQPSYRAFRSPKTWYLTHNLASMRLPKTAHLIMMASKLFSSSKMSKTGKNQKIRYKSVITKKSVIFEKSKIDFKSTGCVPVSLQPLATITHAYFQLYMLSNTRNQYFTSKKGYLLQRIGTKIAISRLLEVGLG